MNARRDAQRRRRATIARWVIRVTGLLTVAVLVGIFLLLAVNAGKALEGGIESTPLSANEVQTLGPDVVADLEATGADPPTVGDIVGSTEWSPSAKGRPSYGILGLVLSTLMTTFIAMAVAVPLGVAAAAWLAFVAKGRARELVKFLVELVAAVPSVVVGFIGIQFVGPLIGELWDAPGGLTALNGGLLLAIMSLPTIVSLSEDALTSVGKPLIDGSLALGADRFQTLLYVAIPAARSGLFAAAMLGMGRAIGETMTVLMATGNVAAIPHGLLDPVRTMTATIAIELGEVARGTTHFYVLFVVGLMLFLITLLVNLAADVVQRRQEKLLG